VISDERTTPEGQVESSGEFTYHSSLATYYV
jgi:hypothetical protein